VVFARLIQGLVCGCIAALLTAGGAQAGTSVQGVRVWRAPDHTRLVFDLSAEARHELSSAANPERLIIDIGSSRVQGRLPPLELAGTPIQRLRSGEFRPGDLRIVLDLHTAVEARSFSLPPSGEYGNRLIVDVYPRGQVPGAAAGSTGEDVVPALATADAAAAQAGTGRAVRAVDAALGGRSEPEVREETAPRELPAPEPPRGRDILVAIDAGHGGDDPGAIGPRRVREKDVTLAIARELEKRINQQPGYRASMVRKGDYFIPLKQRRDLARKTGADLFVSIHADAFTHSRARGGSVYALSPRGATSASAAFLAERENGADLIGGVGLGEKDDLLAGVLTDLSMTATMDASLGAGNRVLSSMGRVAHLHKRQVEQAGFAVLKSPDMPSILVETGFISNPAEAERLGTRSYQRAMANSIFEGLGNYFLNTPPPDTQVAIMVRNGALPAEYIIARGDTLSGIAERYRVSVAEIVRTNRLGDSGGIQAGQRIRIPQS
jgi:N-acetylmuramoyl-L-alanine amidase